MGHTQSTTYRGTTIHDRMQHIGVRVRPDQLKLCLAESKRLRVRGYGDIVRLAIDEYFARKPKDRGNLLVELRKEQERKEREQLYG